MNLGILSPMMYDIMQLTERGVSNLYGCTISFHERVPNLEDQFSRTSKPCLGTSSRELFLFLDYACCRA